MIHRRRFLGQVAAGAAAAALARSGSAQQAYPDKSVRIIVPFPPGGSVDALARHIAQRLTSALGQNVGVVNKAGGNSVIGSDLVAKRPLLAKGALIVCLTPNLPPQTFGELVSYAKANPGKLNFAIGSVGSGGHIATELLKGRTGTDLFVLPYKGSQPAYVDLMSGEIQGFVEPALGAMPHVKSGRIRAVAVTSAARLAALPSVPTVAESGVAGFEFYAWYGLWAPGNTPSEVVALLNSEVNKILAEDELKTRLGEQGFDTQQSSPDEFARFVRDDYKSVGKIIADAGIKVQ